MRPIRFLAVLVLTLAAQTAGAPRPATAHDLCDGGVATHFARYDVQGTTYVGCSRVAHSRYEIKVCLEVRYTLLSAYSLASCTTSIYDSDARFYWMATTEAPACGLLGGIASMAYWRTWTTYTIDDHPPSQVVGSDNLLVAAVCGHTPVTPSSECSETVYRVQTGGARFQVSQHEPDPQTVWLCVRADAVVGYGAKIMLQYPELPDAQTGIDNLSAACLSQRATNTVLGPHPVISGEYDGQPYALDVYAGPYGTWICMEAEGVRRRIIVSATTENTIPAVRIVPDGIPVAVRCELTGGTQCNVPLGP